MQFGTYQICYLVEYVVAECQFSNAGCYIIIALVLHLSKSAFVLHCCVGELIQYLVGLGV